MTKFNRNILLIILKKKYIFKLKCRIIIIIIYDVFERLFPFQKFSFEMRLRKGSR